MLVAILVQVWHVKVNQLVDTRTVNLGLHLRQFFLDIHKNPGVFLSTQKFILERCLVNDLARRLNAWLCLTVKLGVNDFERPFDMFFFMFDQHPLVVLIGL